MCSTTRGPAIWPSLVTCPTRITAAPERLAKRISVCAAPRTCVTVPGARVHHVGPHGLDRVDDDEARGRALGQGCDDVFNRRLSGELDRSAGETEPFGAQPHLRDRLFTRNINRALLRLRQRRRHLDQQRRLADAGVAAEQQHRSAHEAAAGDAIEFGDAGGEAGRVLGLAGRAARAQSAGPCAAHGRDRPGARRLPRRSCSTRRRSRTCPASGRYWAPQFWQTKLSVRRATFVVLKDQNPAGFGCYFIMSVIMSGMLVRWIDRQGRRAHCLPR